jgi:hypothetical protein
MATLVPTNVPGEFAIPALGAKIALKDWEEKDIYDTIAIGGGAQLVNDVDTLEFYTNVQGKRRIDTNLKKNSATPARHEIIVLKPGFFVKPKWGTATAELADQLAFYEEGVYELVKNEKPQVTESHLWRMATGYGFVAYGVDFGAPGVTVAPGSLGVASPAAIPPLLVPFTIGPEDDFAVTVRYQNSQAGVAAAAVGAPAHVSHTLAQTTACMAVLHGFVKSPGTK